MSITTTPTVPASRTSEGAASIERLHDAWRTGALRVTPATPAPRRASMTADPLLLDSGIPTLTQRQAARHHRRAPHLHLVHRVDTETDIPQGLDGVAIGYTALPEERSHATGDADLYQAEPIAPVDRRLRAITWRVLLGVYGVSSLVLLVVSLYRLFGA
ncbi:hypothetical protein [Hydrogenophaga sp. NH-16]|uniref:hypothetical protein n=1 Tax=Hydrogenophaga sp. NH-16 TaxID=2184519 RepID=UPI000FDCBF33|nr:hypothetical protein [Hydrogenophaga sp. NH-16]